jgi:hypothetical protein
MKNLLMMIIGTFGARKGVIFLVDAQAGQLEAVTQRGLGKPRWMPYHRPYKRSFAEIEDVRRYQILDDSENIRRPEEDIYFALIHSYEAMDSFAVNKNFQGGIGLGTSCQESLILGRSRVASVPWPIS